MLVPVACYTFPPSPFPVFGNFAGTGLVPFVDTLSMQISGGGATQDVRYTVCLFEPGPGPCTSVNVIASPTPVTCFEYDANIEPCSAPGTSDGSITINVQQGNGPYDIIWNTGATDWSLNELAEGNYWFQISDANGCTEQDTVVITADGSVNAGILEANVNSIYYDACFQELVVEFPTLQAVSGEVRIFDCLGTLIWTATLDVGSHRYTLPQLPTGLYVAQLWTGGTSSVLRKLYIMPNP